MNTRYLQDVEECIETYETADRAFVQFTGTDHIIYALCKVIVELIQEWEDHKEQIAINERIADDKQRRREYGSKDGQRDT
jgi:hypothetical protein